MYNGKPPIIGCRNQRNASRRPPINKVLALQPNLKEILAKVRVWVKSSSSEYNEKLLNWLKLPFQTPNKDMDDSFLLLIENIGDDHYVSKFIIDEYLWMLETICDGIYILPSNFDEHAINNESEDILDLMEKKDLKVLLIHVWYIQVNGEGHSYLAAIDFTEKVITFIDTGDGLISLTARDNDKISNVKIVANQLKPAEYTIKIIMDAPADRADKFDCAFHTCLFAKCLARKDDYHQLKEPCRKAILYEFLNGQLI